MKCNDCGKPEDPLLVSGVSDRAGGEYYNGPGICEECIKKRREDAIIWHELEKIDTIDHSFYDEC